MLATRLFSCNTSSCQLPCGTSNCYGDSKADIVHVDAAALGLLVGMDSPVKVHQRHSRVGKENMILSRCQDEMALEHAQACRRAEMERWEDDQRKVAEIRFRWELERQETERRQAEELRHDETSSLTSSGDTQAEQDRRAVVEVKGEVWRIFNEHAPSRVEEVPTLFEKYAGLERELYLRLCQKYDVEPRMSLMPLDQEEVQEDVTGFTEECSPEVLDVEDRCADVFEHERVEIEQAAAMRVTLVEFLASHGFKGINSKKKRLLKSHYPLHVAVNQNNVDVVRVLLAMRADASLSNSAGQSPLRLAQRLNTQSGGAYGDLVDVLQQHGKQ